MKVKIVALVFLLFATTIAPAQTQRSGDANARAAQQLQQLSAERAQLKSDNDKLKSEVEELKKKLTAATAGQSALQQRVAAAEAKATRDASSSQQNSEQVEKQRAQMQELVGRFRETAASLKEVESDRGQVKSQLQERDRELTACIDRNVGMYALNTELLDRLENKGVWNSLTEKEPFTQIQRTRLENLIEAYRDRVADLQDTPKRPK